MGEEGEGELMVVHHHPSPHLITPGVQSHIVAQPGDALWGQLPVNLALQA